MNYSEYISYLPLAEDLQAEFTDKWQNFTYQCRGRRYNYTTENIVDSDLLGIGVTITFVITAIATFAIIIYGFYRGLIVDKFQNPIDKALLKWLGTKRPIGDAQWKREKVAFHSAVSALGDQQLVICFAILIAGLANCELSVYGLQNLLAVAWLGLVAHMLTLVVTSPDAKNNRVTSFFRRFMMLCMICLFKFTSSFYVYTYYASAWMFAFSQYFSERNLSGDELLEHDIVTQQSMDGLAQAMPTYSAHFLLGRALLLFKPAPTMRQGFEWDALNVVMLIFEVIIVNYVILVYIQALQHYNRSASAGGTGRQDSESIFPLAPKRSLSLVLFRYRAAKTGIDLPENFQLQSYKLFTAKQRWIHVQEKARKIAVPRDSRRRLASVGDYLRLVDLWACVPVAPTPAIYKKIILLGTLLIQALTRFGICWIVGYKEIGNFNPNIENDIMTWGSGQIMAVIFLILPIVSWMQIFYYKGPVECVEMSKLSLPRPTARAPVIGRGPESIAKIATSSNELPSVRSLLDTKFNQGFIWNDVYSSKAFLQCKLGWLVPLQILTALSIAAFQVIITTDIGPKFASEKVSPFYTVLMIFIYCLVFRLVGALFSTDIDSPSDRVFSFATQGNFKKNHLPILTLLLDREKTAKSYFSAFSEGPSTNSNHFELKDWVAELDGYHAVLPSTNSSHCHTRTGLRPTADFLDSIIIAKDVENSLNEQKQLIERSRDINEVFLKETEQTIAYCCAFREFLSGPLVVKDPITLPGRTFAGPDGISAPSHIGNASHSSAPAPPLGAVHSDLHIDSTKGTYDIDIEEQR